MKGSGAHSCVAGCSFRRKRAAAQMRAAVMTRAQQVALGREAVGGSSSSSSEGRVTASQPNGGAHGSSPPAMQRVRRSLNISFSWDALSGQLALALAKGIKG